MILLALAGCSGLKMEDQCTVTREVKTTYVCEPGGKVEHYRVTPAGAEP